MHQEPRLHATLAFKAWIRKHMWGLAMLFSLLFFVALIHFFGWWEAIGILFLKFGLGIKVAGAKTFTHAIIKAGGKKAIAIATAGMLIKRHIIDIVSKFFAKHSVSRYKKNIILVLKLKFQEIHNSSIVQKIKTFGSILLTIPMVYFFWTKVLGAVIQKFVYALVVPLFTLAWNTLLVGINFINFLFQIMMINFFIEAIAKYQFGQRIIALFGAILTLFAKILNLVNALLVLIGFNPKAYLIRFSNRFNRWLESILDKGLSSIKKLENRRARYINGVENISEKRYLKAQRRRDKQISHWNYIKNLYKKIVLKQTNWRQFRIERKAKWQTPKQTSHYAISKKVEAKRKKRNALHLPYHIMSAKSYKMKQKSNTHRYKATITQ